MAQSERGAGVGWNRVGGSQSQREECAQCGAAAARPQVGGQALAWGRLVRWRVGQQARAGGGMHARAQRSGRQQQQGPRHTYLVALLIIDTLAKGHGVILLGCESTGALFTAFALLLKTLGRAAAAPGTHDSTVYGSGRASPQSFYAHHVAAISSAVVHADALTVLNAAASMSFKLSVGMAALD